MVKQYKCSNCGSDMVFSPKSGQLTCNSCGNIEDISSFAYKGKPSDKNIKQNSSTDNIDKEAFDNEYYHSNDSDNQSAYNFFNNSETVQYECHNCGAKLIVDSQTTSTSCSFCSSAMVLSDRFEKNIAPSLIIPFKIGKSEAQEAFRKWCKNGRLTPNDFMTADRIANISGIYVPFWLFDLNARGEIQATCTKVRSYTQGNYMITETKYYNVYRKIDLDYLKLPCDASQKMDDKLMDKLEPFHYNDLKPFNLPYLAGYVSEKYDYTDKELLPRVKSRAKNFADDFARSTISGYSSVRLNYNNIHINQIGSHYTLCPVWLVYYNYANRDYIFSMNGQTGKVVGKPPISKAKVLRWFLSVFASSFVIMQLLSLFMKGGF